MHVPTEYLKAIGRKGGLSKSDRKSASSAENVKKALAARLAKQQKTDK
jgi:hypothetical protein